MKSLTLREARKQKGWTQDVLAAKSGINQTTISCIETGGVTRPAFITVVKLAAALGIDPRVLRFGQSEAMAS